MGILVVFFRVAFANTLALALMTAHYQQTNPFFQTTNPYSEGSALLAIGAISLLMVALIDVVAPAARIPLIGVPFDAAYTKLTGFAIFSDIFVVAISRLSAPGLVVPDVALVFLSASGTVYFLPERLKRIPRGIDRSATPTGVTELRNDGIRFVVSAVLIGVAFWIFVSQYDLLFEALNPRRDATSATPGQQVTLAEKLFLALVFSLVIVITSEAIARMLSELVVERLSMSNPPAMVLTLFTGAIGFGLALLVTLCIPYTGETDLYWRAVFVFLATVQPLFEVFSGSGRRLAGLES